MPARTVVGGLLTTVPSAYLLLVALGRHLSYLTDFEGTWISDRRDKRDIATVDDVTFVDDRSVAKDHA
jgi:hypothetical protein